MSQSALCQQTNDVAQLASSAENTHILPDFGRDPVVEAIPTLRIPRLSRSFQYFDHTGARINALRKSGRSSGTRHGEFGGNFVIPSIGRNGALQSGLALHAQSGENSRRKVQNVVAISSAVYHNILEFSARVLASQLNTCSIPKLLLASISCRRARSSGHVLDHPQSTQI